MSLQDRGDDRPVQYGDLIAARWWDDPSWQIGKVDEYASYGIDMDRVDSADHVVRLMTADEFRRMIEDMSQRAFDPVVSRFPMITTGDFSPLATLAFDKALEEAVIDWLDSNYPK